MLITYEDWKEKYKPIKNPKRSGIAFDSYYEEDRNFLRENQSKDALNIWTLVDGDDGELFIDSGYRLVNRLEYYITEVSRENKDDFVQVEY